MKRAFPILTALGFIAMVAGIYMVFVYAPIEQQMGVVQKIFYFHVSSAFMCYLGFIGCAVASLGYLWNRRPTWDLAAFASAEVGLVFGLIVVITGPIWARPIWGVWWRWEPRLTSMALLLLIYAAYWVLRTYGGDGEGARRFAAALGVFGAPNIYFIRYAVSKWRGIHPNVIGRKGGGLDADMKIAWLVVIVAFGLLFGLLLRIRYRARRDERTLGALRRRLSRLRMSL